MFSLFPEGYITGIVAVMVVLIIKEAIKDYLDLSSPVILYSAGGLSFIGIITLNEKLIGPILMFYMTIAIPFIFPYLFDRLSNQKSADQDNCELKVRHRRKNTTTKTGENQQIKRGEQ